MSPMPCARHGRLLAEVAHGLTEHLGIRIVSSKLPVLVALLAHHLGSIILVGSLLFPRAVALPAGALVRRPQARLKLRLAAIRLSLRWVWAGIALLYGTAAWAVVVLIGPTALSLHLIWKLSLSLALLVLLPWVHMGLFWSVEQAMAEDHFTTARALYTRLDWALRLCLALAVTAMLLGVLGR